MRYTIEIRPAAHRQMRKLPPVIQQAVLARLEDLEANPYPVGCKKRRDPLRLYRVRVGEYRIIYQVHEQVLVVVMVKVGHRRDIYRR